MSRRFIDIPFTTARPHEIMNNPPAVFATDLVYFLACEFQTGWNPPTLRNYVISDLSPFNMALRRAARNLVRRRNVDYNAKYDALINPNAADKLAQFTDYAKLVLSTVVEDDRDVAYIFLHIVYIARLSLVFYQRGTLDAPVFAAMLISHTIVQLNIKTNGHIYNILSNFAEKVTEDQA